MNSPGGYVYILYGEDTFGRDEALLTLKERMRALPAGEHNMTELSGNEASVINLRMAADAVPFLADRRLVLVRGMLGRLTARGGFQRRTKSGALVKTKDNAPDELQALLDYLPNVPHTSSIVFVEEARLNPQPFLGVIPRGRALVREFPRVQDVAGWVRGRARQLEIDLDESAVRELSLLGGADLRRLDSEIRKLGAFAAGRTVTRADVHELVVGRDINVWALLDGLTERRVDKALRALHLLYGQGEPPEALLGRDIAPHFRRLMVARELQDASPEERARIEVADLGLNPATVQKWSDDARRFEAIELQRALELLLELDRQIKTGETSPDVALELAIVQLCSRLAPVA
ncbi:MAG TPA: DNA polymerase III subunit delta [Chloroflexota bacterium]